MLYLSLKVITSHDIFSFLLSVILLSGLVSPRYCNNIFIILDGYCFYASKGRHPSTLPHKTLIYCFSLNPPTKSPLKLLSIELKSPGKIETLW